MRTHKYSNSSGIGATLTLVLALQLCTISCRTRTFGDKLGNAKSKQASISPIRGAHGALLVDSPEFLKGKTAPRNVQHFLVLTSNDSSSRVQERLQRKALTFSLDSLIRFPDAAKKTSIKPFRAGNPFPTEVLELSNPVNIAALQSTLEPRPALFGAATVLEVLRANRREMSKLIEGGG